MISTRRRRRLAGTGEALLVLLIGLLVGSGALATRRAPVHAADLSLTGVLAAQPDGSLSFDDGSEVFSVVSVIDFTPFLDRDVQLLGTAEDGTLYVQQLTQGAITLTEQGGAVELATTGSVEEAVDGFQMTVEGITLTLVDSDELASAVGQTASVEGELVGSVVSVTSLIT